MFAIVANIVQHNCLKISDGNVTHWWHCRFGHLGAKGLKVLVQKNMVKGLPPLRERVVTWDDCLAGKQHRVFSFFLKKSTRRATKKLQLIHVEIYRPINPDQHSHKRYFFYFYR